MAIKAAEEAAEERLIARNNEGIHTFSHCIISNSSRHAARKRLYDLSEPKAHSNQHSSCEKGTRQRILQEVEDWAANSGSQPIFAIVDQAGTGKSTILMHAARQWEERLVFRFFFSRPSNVISGTKFAETLACDLFASDSFLRSMITQILENNPNLANETIEKKLQLLVLDPLQEFWTIHATHHKELLSRVREEIVTKSHMENGAMEALLETTRIHRRPAMKKLLASYKKVKDDVISGIWNKENLGNVYMCYLRGAGLALSMPIIIVDAFDECSANDRANILEMFVENFK